MGVSKRTSITRATRGIIHALHSDQVRSPENEEQAHYYCRCSVTELITIVNENVTALTKRPWLGRQYPHTITYALFTGMFGTRIHIGTAALAVVYLYNAMRHRINVSSHLHYSQDNTADILDANSYWGKFVDAHRAYEWSELDGFDYYHQQKYEMCGRLLNLALSLVPEDVRCTLNSYTDIFEYEFK